MKNKFKLFLVTLLPLLFLLAVGIFLIFCIKKNLLVSMENQLVEKIEIDKSEDANAIKNIYKMNAIVNNELFYIYTNKENKGILGSIFVPTYTSDQKDGIINKFKDSSIIIDEIIEYDQVEKNKDNVIVFENVANHLDKIKLNIDHSFLYKIVRRYVTNNEKTASNFYVEFFKVVKLLYLDKNSLAYIFFSVDDNAINMFYPNISSDNVIENKIYSFESNLKSGFSAKKLMLKALVDMINYNEESEVDPLLSIV